MIDPDRAHASTARLTLTVMRDPLAVCRLAPDARVPDWATESRAMTAIVRTADELSIVTAERDVPPDVRAERGFRAMRVRGPLAFALVGVLASIAQPLAAAGISLFAISTFETDYVLVREHDLARAIDALERAGHVMDHESAHPPRG